MQEPSQLADSEDFCNIQSLGSEEFDGLRRIIYEAAGITLSEGKRAMVCSRLARRLRHLGLKDFAAYYRFLCEQGANGEERQELINCLTTNKTDFFREAHHFDYLRDVVFPNILQRANRGGPKRLRIWCAASSTGEEPYTLALVVREYFGPPPGWDVRILASDIDTDVLARAERGWYALEDIQSISDAWKRKYFLRGQGPKLEGLAAVRPELKNLISFRQINLIRRPWPIQSKFDAIFCRNVFIYFDRPTQKGILEAFSHLLHPEGRLFLGHSENIHGVSNLFRALGSTIYQLETSGSSSNGVEPLEPLSTDTDASEAQDSDSAISPSRRLSEPSAGKPATTPPAPPVAEAKNQDIRDETLVVGDVKAAERPTRFKTLLGSCVSACLYDPVTGIGGMNHFSLPDAGPEESISTRYGVHAMELLINEVMRLGGDRRRLVAKVFGGAKVIAVNSEALNIGYRNSTFVLHFLSTEGIPVAAKCLGGTSGLRVHFYPHTGQALVRPLDGSTVNEVVREEDRYSRSVRSVVDQPAGSITLF